MEFLNNEATKHKTFLVEMAERWEVPHNSDIPKLMDHAKSLEQRRKEIDKKLIIRFKEEINRLREAISQERQVIII
jgi:hypothetical protein